MQHRFVLLIGDCSEHFLFLRCGISEQGQGLVAVTGQEHAVISLDFSAPGLDLDVLRVAADPFNGAIQADPVTVTAGQLVEIIAGSTLDHSPGGPVVDGQQAMVVKKADEESRRHGTHSIRCS